jgi:hypothetical protein
MPQSLRGVGCKSIFDLVLAILAVLVLLPQAASAQSYVLGRVDAPVTRNASVMATGDFNNDGILDFAVVNETSTFSGSVTIFLGKTNGSLSAPMSFALSDQPGLAIITGDFNGDGKLDLAATTQVGQVVILLGNGDGTFQSPKTTTFGLNLQGLAAGDLNGDGKLDLAVADQSGQLVSVLPGNGDGTFQTHVDYPIGSTANKVTIADLNHDGKLDLVVLSGFSQKLSILLGNGDGTFQAHVDYPAGSNPVQAVVADLNGDGNMDLVVANGYFGGAIDVYLGKGDGTFPPLVSYPVGVSTSSLALGDFNGDGKLDVAAADDSDNYVSILLGNGNGTLQTAVNYPSGFRPVGIAAVDFNGDGKLDLEFLNPTNNDGTNASIAVLLGHGDGTFHNDASYATVTMEPYNIVTADFNGDGKPDLAIRDDDNTGASISVLLNTGAGKFGAASAVTAATGPLWLAAGDFNGDKNADLVVDDTDGSNNPYLTVLLGNGDGTFQTAVNHAVPGNLQWLVAGDFNGDGKLDVAGIQQANAVAVFLGNGDGTFANPTTYATGAQASFMASGDLNGDGKPDLVVSNHDDATISVYVGKGDGTFANQVVYNPQGQPSAMAIADVNGDGKLDIIVANSNSQYAVFLGKGDGTFPQTPILNQINGLGVGVIQTGDFNGDGQIDLVIGSGGPSVSIVYGNGDGTFTTESDFAITQPPFTLAVADFNGDGTLDFATPNLGLGNVTVFLSEPSAFVYPSMLTFASEPQGGTSAPQTVTLTNPSAVPFTVTGLLTAGDFGATHTCSVPLEGGSYASCTAAVTFTPTGGGTRMGEISFADDVPGNPQVVALKGTGAAGPAVSLSPKAITFTQVVNTTSDAKVVTLGNTGTLPLMLTSAISVSGDYTETDNCGTSVAAGGSCTINVTFAPTATGARNGVLTINDNAAGSPHTVGLTGVSVDFTIAPAAGSPTSVTVAAGQQATYQLTLIGVSDFSGQAALACTGAPSEATCSVSPASATLTGATPASVTVTVTTTAASNVMPSPSGDGGKPRAPIAVLAVLAAIMSMMAMFLAASLSSGSRSRLSRYRVAFQAVLALAAFASLAALTSCGGGGGKGPTNPGTPAGTYTLTVTGTLPVGSGTATHSQALTLIVQ